MCNVVLMFCGSVFVDRGLEAVMKTALPRVQLSWVTGCSPRGLWDRLGHCRVRMHVCIQPYVVEVRYICTTKPEAMSTLVNFRMLALAE